MHPSKMGLIRYVLISASRAPAEVPDCGLPDGEYW